MMTVFRNTFAAAALAFGSVGAHASIIYSNWTGDAAPNGNYILTVSHDSTTSKFDYNLTVNPWNAEALALFIDFGNVNLSGPVSITGASPAGEVTLVGMDTSSNTCGSCCNLNGVSVPLTGDGQWELVFGLGDSGFDGIQTFSWNTQDFGLDESAFGLVALRGQQVCTSGTLPNSGCSGSDKLYAFPDAPQAPRTPSSVPEPATALLIGLGLLVVPSARRKARAEAK
jgi:hypothetical protein